MFMFIQCFGVFGQDWQDEEHVWDEGKQQWVVKNKAGGRVVNVDKDPQAGDNFQVPDEEWARFLPLSVRSGKRAPTDWEVSEAQRKLWAKEILTQRAVERAEKRRQLIAYRKSSGWYAARRSGYHSRGLSWPMQMHVQSVSNYYGGGRYGY